ncbi:MAG: acyltransferase [Flavobacterium sp.]|nr:acyltransferase [Pedobacter sp.]
MLRLLAKIVVALNQKFQSVIYRSYRSKYNISPAFRFNGINIMFYGNGQIDCGPNSYIGDYSTIQAYDNCKVVIGKRSQISHNVRIYTCSDVADQDFSKEERAIKMGDVIIGDYAWIGANVFINPGVIIGENSIVGANSVLTKNVEPWSIVGGVPAKLIRYKTRCD